MLPSEGGAGPVAVPMPGFAGAGIAAASLATELTSFTKFRARIDELLRDLKESPAGPGKLAEDPMSRRQFGGGDNRWAEAASLFTSYRTVITELETLSKLLSDCIEGMSIAVLASHNGYANIDEDLRRRMLAISDGVENHYGGKYDPTGQRNGQGPPDVPKPEPTTGSI
ncbi:hypothetical protein AB0P41_31405 [Streptomyces sp. NPDC079167]|uniref:hypothetical protein n=1 Tax=Streptomyces sp. NPDC079167 TaxID=3154513 RepID=UPI003421AA21